MAPEGVIPSFVRIVSARSFRDVSILAYTGDVFAIVIHLPFRNSISLVACKCKRNQKSTVTVKKEWSDGEAAHSGDSVTVQLYRYTQKQENSGEDVGDETIRLSLNTKWMDEDGNVVATWNGNFYDVKVTALP